MNEFMRNLFQWEGGPEITFMSIWHIMYIVLIIGSTIALAFILKNKSQAIKERVLKIYAIATIVVYITDFFFMPFSRANGDETRQLIDVEKLPFHLCTFISVMIPFAQFIKNRGGRINSAFREIVATLAIASSLMYIAYPGSALGDIGTFNYTVVETFLFHGLVFTWGVLSLTTGSISLNFKNIWKPLIGILIIMAWATLGNYAYLNDLYACHGNWCFLRVSFFSFIPDYLMPLAFLVSVFGICAIIYSVDLIIKKIVTKTNKSKTQPIEEQKIEETK